MALQREYIKREKGQIPTIAMSHCYVTSLIENPPPMERLQKTKEWKDTMIKEYKLIMKNDVWEIVSRPKKKFVVTLKWIYKIKDDAYGSIEKHKARFVAQASHRKKA